jgi:hypothetical protein
MNKNSQRIAKNLDDGRKMGLARRQVLEIFPKPGVSAEVDQHPGV